MLMIMLIYLWIHPNWIPCNLQSYDATTHFESTVTDVLNMYAMITGKVRIALSFVDFLLKSPIKVKSIVMEQL